jgi:hypothetical protein
MDNGWKMKWVKRIVSVSAAVVLTAAGWPSLGTGYAAEQSSAGGAVDSPNGSASIGAFTDVQAGHWAEKHILKLAAQGIVKGDRGKFNPSGNVTRQDAVIMAIRMMGLEQRLDREMAVVFPERFEVRNYAKPYVSLAFEIGLLDQDAEYAAAAQANGAWGDVPATREWVTHLLIQAIDAEPAVESVAAGMFKDEDQIAPQYRKSVDEAVRLGLIKGVTEDTFQPKGKINRASIATMFSRAQAHMELTFDHQYEGIVLQITEQRLEMRLDDGTKLRLDRRPGDPLFSFASEKRVPATDLEPYMRVLAIEREGAAVYLEITDDQLQLEQIEGELVKIYPDDQTLTLLAGDKYREISYDPALRVRDNEGNEVPLSSLIPGTKLTAGIDAFGSTQTIVMIRVSKIPVNKQGEGTLQQADPAAGTVTITDKDSGLTEVYPVSAQASIHDRDMYIVRLGDLLPGSRIAYEVRNGEVVSLVLTESAGRILQGQLNSVDPAKRTLLYVNDDGKLNAHFIAQGAEVVLPGMNLATLADLEPGDRIVLHVNGQDQVTRIEVTNRKVEMKRRAVVVLYEPDTKLLAIKDEAGNPGAYYLSERTRIDLNGNPMTLEAMPSLLVKNKRVTFTYTGSHVITLQLSDTVDGTLAAYHPTNQTIQLMTEDGQLETYYMSGTTVESFRKPFGTLNDVKIGDSVRALLNAEQNRVLKLQLKETVQVEVKSVDPLNRKLSVKDGSGSAYEITLGTSVPIQDGSRTNVLLTEIAPGERWNISFAGTTVTSMSRVHVTYGTVLATDSASGALTVRNVAGTTQTFTLGEGYRIIKNGNAAVLSQITANDRVEIRKDEQERDVVTVIAGMEKKYWKFDSATNEIYVKRSSLADQNYRYPLAANAFVHRNGTVIHPTAIQDGEAIVLYLIGGQVIELEVKPNS